MIAAAWIPVLYAVVMAAEAVASLVLGAAFDRFGMATVMAATVLTAAFAPLVFLSGAAAATLGMVLWGVGMAAQESVVKAAVTGMVPTGRRATAYGDEGGHCVRGMPHQRRERAGPRGATMNAPERAVVVGIAEGQADAVALVAAEFAAKFDAQLVCAVVDEAHYTTTDRAGHPVYAPIDPDAVDDVEAEWSRITDHLHDVLDRVTPNWTVRFITGEPSAALAAIAAEVDALMIVIGTRRSTVARSIREFFSGSIAAHLAHRQPRPVLVVPLDPAPLDHPLPWQQRDEDSQ